jgi:hypothetical protein
MSSANALRRDSGPGHYGRPADWYNSEVASTRLAISDRTARGRSRRTLRDSPAADRRGHVEYGRRAPAADVELLLP